MLMRTIARRFLASSFLFVVAAQFSCSKTSTPAPASKFTILTATKWKVKALYFRDVNEPVSANVDAIYFTYKACEKDDIYLFYKDSTFSRKDSLIRCSDQDLDPFHINIFGPYGNSTWSATPDFSQMRIILANSYFYNWKILTLNESEFRVEENYQDLFGDKHIYTYVFQPEGK